MGDIIGPSAEQLLSFLVIVGGLALGYGKGIGPRQMIVMEAICTATEMPGKYKPIFNILLGIILAMIVTAYVAWRLGQWDLLGLGFIAGLFASEVAAEKHDEKSTVTVAPEQVTVEGTVSGGQDARTQQQRTRTFFNDPPVRRGVDH